MDYLVFDLLVAALPAALLLRGPVLRLRGPVLALAVVAVLWTAPWDVHLVRTGVWTYDPGAVVARIGVIPVEEYAFVILQVLLVAAWAGRVGVLPGRPAIPRPPTHRGALGWAGVALLGVLLLVAGGHLRYLGLLLVWAAPPLALQHLVAGDVLAARRAARLRAAVPTALWLCAADRLALAHGIWAIAPGSASGVGLLGLPVEEALFFALTCLLVSDGLLLAADPVVLSRCRAALGAVAARLGSSLGVDPLRAGTPTGPRPTSLPADPQAGPLSART